MYTVFDTVEKRKKNKKKTHKLHFECIRKENLYNRVSRKSVVLAYHE